MRKTLKRIFFRWYVIIALVILVIVGLYYWTHRAKAPSYETAVAATGNIIEKVSVTGQIMPVDKADLAFEKSGVITVLNVKVGQSVKRGDLIAKLDDAGDVAALAAAEAKLDDLSRGLRPEELAADQAKVGSASVALANVKQDAVNAIRTAYIQAQSAVVNYADSLFTNPQSANPNITVRTDSQTRQNSIDSERVAVGDTLGNWKSAVDMTIPPDHAADFLDKAQGYATTIKAFLNDLSGIVNGLNPGNSGLTQQVIDAELTAMNSALSGVNQSVTSLTAASSELRNAVAAYDQANNDFNVANAGSSPQAIRAQSATVATFQAELDKDRLLSPIAGVITKADPKVGEFVAAGSSAFTVQSDGQYKIEAYVPEADIAKVALADAADVTLDAYSSDTHFATVVSSIDPAETVLEGVPTYKVTLLFGEPDARIRSGMTANTEISTHEVDNVVTVPTRAIIDAPSVSATGATSGTFTTTSPTASTTAGSKAVRILNADGKSFTTVPVKVGLKGSDGTTEIISGVSAGQKVVTYVK
jgi:multidrug efflux pump subunit AcrA (membrane-fusion protein)